MESSVLLPFLTWSLVTGIKLSPCGNDGFSEMVANLENLFTCTAQALWTLRLNNNDEPISLAKFKNEWKPTNNFGGIFTAGTTDRNHASMFIKPVNNTELLWKHMDIVNSSLECSDSNNESDRCGLNLVYPPEDVRCSASNTSWSVNVSCVIGSVYSSRRIYKCQLIRHSYMAKNESLQTVTMMTSPTSERIAEKEVKVSGICQFNTTLPAEEGSYGFSVSISPGSRTVSTGKMWFTVERPMLPTMSCGPQPYVEENFNVTCTCNTTSLGQPEGSLRWVTGNPTNKERGVWENQQILTPLGLLYSQHLTLSDHNNTWFRCDILWGTETVFGEKYTANVGYAARTPQLSVGGSDRNQTVMEGEQVQLACQSDGRPSPNISISNNDNGDVIGKDASTNYTFIARCEDAATYTCSARNEFSSQSGETTSLSLNVGCKPRSASATSHLGNVTFGNKTKEVKFNIIAYPVPSESHVWLERPTANSEHSYEKVESSQINVTCKADTEKRYLSRCTLSVSSIPCSSTAWYKVQVVNKHGDVNFTVVISYGKEDKQAKLAENHLAAFGSVAAVFLVAAIAVLVVVIRKKKQDFSRLPRAGLSTSSRHLDNNRRPDEGSQPLQPAEIIYEIPWDSVRTQGLAVQVASGKSMSQPDPFLTPLYAVVDKTKKKSKKQGPEATDDFEEQSQQNTNVIYAVVDKARSKTPAKRAQNQTLGKDPKPKKSQWKKLSETDSWCNDNNGVYYENSANLAMHALPSQNEASGQNNPYSLAACLHEPDDGRWENDDGLIYTLPVFDVRNDVRRPPAPRSEETEYCTIRGIETKFPALDKN